MVYIIAHVKQDSSNYFIFLAFKTCEPVGHSHICSVLSLATSWETDPKLLSLTLFFRKSRYVLPF